ncbi:MAG: hypothetical protein H8E21_12390 [Gammaproteobacteria bacterium]|nr:hypothetical protein [Gammaproteobacteria bacterium]MBL6998468.1 hypothetical protein [Gammaproteobacteria bacterium]
MIFRLLLLFLIIWFLFWIIKKQFLGTSSSTQQIPDESEDIIPCKLCGTHVPRSLGVKKDDRFYCSQEHADQYQTDLDEK